MKVKEKIFFPKNRRENRREKERKGKRDRGKGNEIKGIREES